MPLEVIEQPPRITFSGRGYRKAIVQTIANDGELIIRVDDGDDSELWCEFTLNEMAVRQLLNLIESKG